MIGTPFALLRQIRNAQNGIAADRSDHSLAPEWGENKANVSIAAASRNSLKYVCVFREKDKNFRKIILDFLKDP